MSWSGGSDPQRFLSIEGCQDLVRRAAELSTGGGSTTIDLDSSWTGNLRWGRNEVTDSGDVRNNDLAIHRSIHGVVGYSGINEIDDTHVKMALRRAERVIQLLHDGTELILPEPYIEPYLHPEIWSDVTYGLDASARARGIQALVKPVMASGLQSAGYVQVSAHGRATMNADRLWYYPYTLAQYSVTIHDADGTGSGWAGVDGNDWAKIDAAGLSEIAIDKCQRSRNPVAVEPGRYTTILEPQAVCDLVSSLFTPRALDRESAELGDPDPLRDSRFYDARPNGIYNKSKGYSKLGERVFDERLTVSSDPMDPELGFPPFFGWDVFHPVTWVKDGVLTTLGYTRQYAVKKLSQDTGGIATTGGYRMSGSGAPATIEEMVATTDRGLLVTRFGGMTQVDPQSPMLMGYTRDGVWLIEHGKITKPVKNLRFIHSPLIALNTIEQIGVSQRVFHPHAPNPFPDGYAPVIVPALKVRDFNFSSLADAV